MSTHPRTLESPARAHLYLNAVAERPTAALWDLVEDHGVVDAARRIREGGLVRGEVAEVQTRARAAHVDVGELLRRAERVDARFLHPGAPGWPEPALAALDAPRVLRDATGTTDSDLRSVALVPFGLWHRGGDESPAPSDPAWARAVAIVGTRDVTHYGRHVAAELGEASAADDLLVVSGGAIGVDVAAHRAALECGGMTAAVLARGVDEFYPSSNAGVLESVARSAGVLSEYPPGTGVTRYRFLDRNRIIAALGTATVVVEAAMRSGALSTARWAENLGRPVAAIPGSIHSRNSAGCNALLRDGRALALTRASEVTALVPGLGRALPTGREDTSDGRDAPRRRTSFAAPPEGLDDVERRVHEALAGNRWRWPEEIAVDTGITQGRVRVALGALLATGSVERSEGRWKLRRRRAGEQTALSW